MLPSMRRPSSWREAWIGNPMSVEPGWTLRYTRLEAQVARESTSSAPVFNEEPALVSFEKEDVKNLRPNAGARQNSGLAHFAPPLESFGNDRKGSEPDGKASIK